MRNMGEKIKKIRKDHKLTQAEFAEIFGLSHSHISNIENNRENPSETLILFICSRFNISYEWLRYGEDENDTVSGYSRAGRINNYNIASREFEHEFRYMNDDEIADYSDSAFSALQMIRSNFFKEKPELRHEILKAQRDFLNRIWLINNITNEIAERNRIDSDDKLEYIMKFNKLLSKAIDDFKALESLILNDTDIEL